MSADLSQAVPISAGSSSLGGPLCLYDKDGNALALISDRLACKERIALDFVKAVNLHDELVEVLREVRDDLAEKIECDLDAACLHDAEGNYLRDTIDDISRPHIEDDEALLDRIKIALAKVDTP